MLTFIHHKIHISTQEKYNLFIPIPNHQQREKRKKQTTTTRITNMCSTTSGMLWYACSAVMKITPCVACAAARTITLVFRCALFFSSIEDSFLDSPKRSP